MKNTKKTRKLTPNTATTLDATEVCELFALRARSAQLQAASVQLQLDDARFSKRIQALYSNPDETLQLGPTGEIVRTPAPPVKV
jgi:hypothetical protein